ncbi:MAG: radical SAM protein [Candidatus Thiodiazotropha taylori]|nr:B12-binding domain-containing radical SAM protein [Candidatus Thiodiazotropha taylori]MCW4316698.1 B12-binding domain-containing radical SAM protein [Candidatus Thiodiazotropha taylori]
MGIASIAAYINSHLKDLVNVEILDLLPLELDVTYVINLILQRKPDVVGVSFLTAQAPVSYRIGQILNRHGVTTVAGGIHPTVCSEEAATSGFDYVVRGEGEEAFLKIIKNLLGVFRHQNDSLMVENDKKIVEAPLLRGEDIPSPAWDLVDFEVPYNESIGVAEGKAVPIMYSRGCAFSCSFCASATIWHKKIRWRSEKSVVDEIVMLVEKYGIHSFHFYDDDFLVSKKHLLSFLDELKRVPLPIEWVALSTVRSICQHHDLLPLLRRAGCIGFDVGIESADISVLKNIGKRQDVSSSKRAIELLQFYEFSYIEPLMMYFNEGETLDSIVSEMDFFKEVGLQPIDADMHQYATPFPGTDFFKSSKYSGILFANGWKDYRTDRVNYIPNTFLYCRLPDLEKMQTINIENILDWNKALDHDDGIFVSTKIMDYLTENNGFSGKTIKEIAELYVDQFNLTGKSEEMLVIKVVSLIAILAARSCFIDDL